MKASKHLREYKESKYIYMQGLNTFDFDQATKFIDEMKNLGYMVRKSNKRGGLIQVSAWAKRLTL